MATTKKTKAKKKVGRKSRYNAKMHPRRATELVEQGLTDKELAEAFGVHVDTIYDWQNKFSEFSESIKKAKEKPNRDVEAALFKRCIGYTYDSDEVTASGEKDAQGANKVIKIVRKKVHVPGDVTAMIFWLKNRMPKEWGDSYRMQHIFNREDGLEGIAQEDEDEVRAAVEAILGIGGTNGDGK